MSAAFRASRGNTGEIRWWQPKDEGFLVTGKKTKVKVVKNKVAPPLKVATFDIMLARHQSYFPELVELGSKLEIIQKMAPGTPTRITVGPSAVERDRPCLKDNPELADEIEAPDERN